MKDKPSEDSFTIRDVVLQAKDAEVKSKADDVHSKAADPKKDLSKTKLRIPDIGFSFVAFF